MRKSKSRISLLLIAILLGSLVTWAPTVSASGNSSPSPHLQAQGINALFDSETESTTVYWSNLVTTDYLDVADARISIFGLPSQCTTERICRL